jgi:hypothetical protein
MKEYKKNMNDKDAVFENRKASLFNNAANQVVPADAVDDASVSAVPSELESTPEETGDVATDASVVAADADAADADVVIGTDAKGSDPTADTIEMSELKDSIEQVDAWSAQKLGIQ